MRLTKVGRRTLLAGVVLVVTARVVGTDELLILGLAAVGAVVTGAAWVALRRVRLRLVRTIRPERVHIGATATNVLEVANLNRYCGIVEIEDQVSTTAGLSLRAGPFFANERAVVAYQLPTAKRGRLTVGPARVTISDPLGLAAATVAGGQATDFLVYPQLVELAPVAFTPGGQTRGAASDSLTLQRLGDDFYALRDYTIGDDPRRIHWRSTARLGRPMVREDENPRAHRVALLLDTRTAAYDADPDRFEVAVSAAASIAAACARRHDRVRLVTTTEGVVVGGDRHHDLTTVLDYLARVQLANTATLRIGLTQLQATAASAYVAVLGATEVPGDSQLEATLSLMRDGASLTALRIDGNSSGDLNRRGQFKLIGLSSIDQIATLWNEAQNARPTPAQTEETVLT